MTFPNSQIVPGQLNMLTVPWTMQSHPNIKHATQFLINVEVKKMFLKVHKDLWESVDFIDSKIKRLNQVVSIFPLALLLCDFMMQTCSFQKQWRCSRCGTVGEESDCRSSGCSRGVGFLPGPSSELRIHHCCTCSLSCSCIQDSILGQETSYAVGATKIYMYVCYY